MKKIFSSIMRVLCIPVIIGGILSFKIRFRVMYLHLLSFLGNIGLKRFPSIYNSLDEQNVKYSSGQRIKEKYLDKEKFNTFLKEAELTNMTTEQIFSEIEKAFDLSTSVLNTPIEQVFDNASRNIEVAVQYSGGCDSTLAAILAARYFKKVHLLSFCSPFIKGKEKSKFNADKIINVFGKNKVEHAIIDTADAFETILFKNYFSDIMKHKTFVLGVGCLACKLSFDVNIIQYAIEHNVSLVLDGADLSVKSQLSQGDKKILEERHKLYAKFGIDFKHPVARFQNNPHELFVLGTDLEPPQIMYAEQPECKGNQFLNEIYDRFYFIPRYGIDIHSEKGLFWLQDKLEICEECIRKS